MAIAEFDLHGKVAFITGSGRGIGAGIARVLAEAGADVAVNALTMKNLGPLTEEITRKTGRKALPYAADLTVSETVENTIQQALRDFGRIDILVNGLGDSIAKSLVPLPDRESRNPAPMSDADIKKVMDLNLTSTILCSRAVGTHFVERRSGKVINIASFSAARGGAGIAIYTAAKAGMAGFTRAMALEWAPYGIQVNSIAPGLFPDVATQGEEGVARTQARAAQTVPLGRAGETREAGWLAVYLSSAASDYMTGQTIYLDGGISL